MITEQDIENCAKMLHEAFLAHSDATDKMTPEEIAISQWGFLPSKKKAAYRAVAAAVLANYAPIPAPAPQRMACGTCGYEVVTPHICEECGDPICAKCWSHHAPVPLREDRYQYDHDAHDYEEASK